MILLLHTLIEGVIALLFMFYPQAGDLVPGFGTSEGASFELLMKMYGWSAALLAGLSLVAYFSRANRVVFLTVTGLLTLFHVGMAIIQGLHNPDPRAMLLALPARHPHRRSVRQPASPGMVRTGGSLNDSRTGPVRARERKGEYPTPESVPATLPVTDRHARRA